MAELLQLPIFSIVFTLFAFRAGVWLREKTYSPLFNPILVATVIVLIFLSGTDMELEVYQTGNVRIRLPS